MLSLSERGTDPLHDNLFVLTYIFAQFFYILDPIPRSRFQCLRGISAKGKIGHTTVEKLDASRGKVLEKSNFDGQDPTDKKLCCTRKSIPGVSFVTTARTTAITTTLRIG